MLLKIIPLVSLLIVGCAHQLYKNDTEWNKVEIDFATTTPKKIDNYTLLDVIKDEDDKVFAHYTEINNEKTKDGAYILNSYSFTNTPKQGYFNKEYLSEKTRLYVHCKNKTISKIRTEYYSDKESRTKPLIVDDKKYVYIPYDLRNEYDLKIHQLVCSDKND